MREIGAYIAAVVLLAAGPAWSGGQGCPQCASQLSLTRKQVECLSRRIDRLLSRPIEPVFFDASACGQTPGTMSPAAVNIPVPLADAHPDALWVQLTKKQLACLKSRIAAIPASGHEPFVIPLAGQSCRLGKS